MNKSVALQFAVEIKTTSGSILKPHELNFWDLSSKKHPQHLHHLTPVAPFKFFTDAILAACYHKMTDYRHLTTEQKTLAEKAYNTFDAYTELYKKSAPRIKSLGTKTLAQKKHFETFEKNMTAAFDQAFVGNKICFTKITSVLNCLSDFETETSAPLLYNFSVNFSAAFTEKLICFYSLLFHLRSVVAVDHNAHVEDSSHESVKCDSISDYLPKSDYTVNDAMLYWHFKQLAKTQTPAVEKSFVNPMHRYFHQYNHNACNLIDQLPESFLSNLNANDLEEALHHVQMDWLLGSASGLLFKIREELFGVLEGYDKVFWPECSSLKPKKASTLNLCFELNEKSLTPAKAAA